MYNVFVCDFQANFHPLPYDDAFALAEWYVLDGYDPMDIVIEEAEFYIDDLGW